MSEQPKGLRTFLAPHRYWFRNSATSPMQRGTLMACATNRHSLFLDVSLSSESLLEVGVEEVVSSTDGQGVFSFRSWQTARPLVLSWAKCLSLSGFSDGVRCYPPRSVCVDEAGNRGWIVGWSLGARGFVVASDVTGPCQGDAPSYSFQYSVNPTAFAVLTQDTVVALNPHVSKARLNSVRDFLKEVRAPATVLVAGAVFPIPAVSQQLPYRMGDKCALGSPDDVCRTLVNGASGTPVRGWDVTALVSALLVCPVLRHALPGACAQCMPGAALHSSFLGVDCIGRIPSGARISCVLAVQVRVMWRMVLGGRSCKLC
jgi:hypothetical protein